MEKWVLAARFIGVGFFIGGSIVLGLLAGLWLDSKFDTHLLWLLGLLTGITVSFWGVYRMLLPLLQNNKDNKDKHESNGR